jgi:hypothetical protein
VLGLIKPAVMTSLPHAHHKETTKAHGPRDNECSGCNLHSAHTMQKVAKLKAKRNLDQLLTVSPYATAAAGQHCKATAAAAAASQRCKGAVAMHQTC